MSTLTKNKRQTFPDTIQPSNALDKKCTQITPGTRQNHLQDKRPSVARQWQSRENIKTWHLHDFQDEC